MEDEKLAAYYDDLTRKGSGAARFKQGLGFSSAADVNFPSRGSNNASSFLGGFVKASSPSRSSEFDKQAQLQSIQTKLSGKPKDKIRDERFPNSSRRSPIQSLSPVRGKSRDIHSRRRIRSRSPDRYSRRRSCSPSPDRYSRRRSSSRDRSDRPRSRKRDERMSVGGSSNKGERRAGVRNYGKKGIGIDYGKLIEGYDQMTPAERVKAKMKHQLSRTAQNDETIGKGSGWERFDFNADAPLDDEEIEAAEDDAVLVKHVGQSFRFSAVEVRKEQEINAAHAEAMFGASSFPPPAETEDEYSQDEENMEATPAENLLSEQVVSMQQGSWRDRARKA